MPRALLFITCVTLLAGSARAQEGGPAPVLDPPAANVPSLDPVQDPGEGTNRKTGKGITPLIAPVPFRNSQLGWGGVLMVGLIHRFDADTSVKPSTGAISGLVSENGSWGVMGLEMARFGRDKWRARGVVGYLDLRYDFYGIGEAAGQAGSSVPVDQTIFLTSGVLLRRVATGLYLGASVLWMETTIQLRDTVGSNQPPLPNQGKTQLIAPGLQAEIDTRDVDYWPSRGSLAQAKAIFFSTESGTSGSFQRYLLAWSWYHGFRGPRLVLATNINVCGAPGDTPFYGLCSLGSGRYALRGYTQGRYRDHFADVLQAELRGHTAGRLGAVVFGGISQVAPDAGEIFNAQVLAAGGVGLRYQLTKKYPMHLRADAAWGRDGGQFYFSVGEAF